MFQVKDVHISSIIPVTSIPSDVILDISQTFSMDHFIYLGMLLTIPLSIYFLSHAFSLLGLENLISDVKLSFLKSCVTLSTHYCIFYPSIFPIPHSSKFLSPSLVSLDSLSSSVNYEEEAIRYHLISRSIPSGPTFFLISWRFGQNPSLGDAGAS
jgi:hypothetical protein